MYLPENNEQMYDILAELRLYAAMNGLPALAERLDDAMIILLSEPRDPKARTRALSVMSDTL